MASYRRLQSPPNVAHVLAGVALGICSLAACGEGTEDETPLAQTEVLAQGASAPDIAEVTASGTGCPKGTWTSQLAEDGKAVTVKFDAFEGTTSARQSSANKDCTLAIKLPGGAELSYAPATVQTVGLGNGVYTTELAWASQPDTKRSFVENRGGRVGYTHLAPDLWSPCGGEQELRVRTDVRHESTGSGPRAEPETFSVAQTAITLAVRRCDAVDVPPENTQPQPPRAVVKTVWVAGSHCDELDARVVPSQDGKDLRVEFSKFDARIGAESSLSSAFCSVMFDVVPPKGYTYALEAFDIRGSGELPAQVIGNISAAASMLGRGPAARRDGTVLSQHKEFTKPLAGDFTFADSFRGSALQFVPCDSLRPVGISISSAVSARTTPKTQGRLTIASLQGVRFALKRCAN